MKKILMINPPTGIFIRDDRCQSNVEEFMISVSRPPHELLIMATVLKNQGHQVIINDYPIEKKSLADYKHDIEEFLPDILVINSTLPTLSGDSVCGGIAKQIDENIMVALRCGAIEYIGEDAMRAEPLLDVIFYGETDSTLSELIKYEDKSKVRGIFYRQGRDIIKTARRPFLEDLDCLPLIDRSLVKNELYSRPDTNMPVGLIEVSRGCPYGCIFCLAPISYGKNHRLRSVHRIIEEIKSCVKKYNIVDFHFKSDLFSLNRRWVLELCREIIKNNLKIKWFANSRVDTIDRELLAAMKESGCFALALGIESGSQEILNKIKKGITLKQIQNSFNLCKDYEIKTYGYFIIGFPWDTEETILETINFSIKVDPDYLDFFFPYAFPGTELYQMNKELNFIDDFSVGKASKNSYIGSQLPTLTVSRKKLVKLRKKALQKFYIRLKYVRKVLRNYKGFKEKMRLLRYGFFSLRKILG